MVGPDGTVSLLGFGTEGAVQTDLRPLAMLAQRFTNRWPAEVDSYLDALQAPEGFKDVVEALAAFPVPVEERDAAGLGRAVKRRVKALKQVEQGDTEPVKSSDTTDGVPSRTRQSPHKNEAKREPEIQAPDEFQPPREARWVALGCGSLVFIAFVLEVWSVPL